MQRFLWLLVRVLPKAAVFQVNKQRHQYPFMAGVETLVAYKVAEQVGHVDLHIAGVKMLEIGKMYEV
jgi:hypothetical protein